MNLAKAAKAVNFKAKICKSWNSKSQDGIELKTYIEYGFCDGFNVHDIYNKYPQFQQYDKKTVYNAVVRFRKKLENELDNRKYLKDGCK